MKAVVMTEDLKLEYGEHDAPSRPDWAVVDVKAAGVCGSELHFLDGMIPTPFSPFILGHEIAGTVSSAPEGSKVKAGDRVAVYNFVGCGQCKWCRTGHESICPDPEAQIGWTANGGFAAVGGAGSASGVGLDHVGMHAAEMPFELRALEVALDTVGGWAGRSPCW